MRTTWGYLRFAILVGAASVAVGQQTSAPAKKTASKSPAVSLVASLPQDSVKAGSPVVVQITITNRRKSEISLDRNWMMAFDVRDNQGAQPLTRRGEILIQHAPRKPGEVLDLPTGGGPYLQLSSKETVNVSQAIPDLFDLSQPGTYTIQVHVPDPAGDGVVRSNTVSVTIVP